MPRHVTPSNLCYCPLEQPPEPDRTDRWEEPLTVRDYTNAILAALVFFPLFLLGLTLWIVMLTPEAGT